MAHKSLYEAIAGHYQELFPVNQDFMALLTELMPLDSRILDLACGPGHYVRELVETYDMTGCDICEPMIAEARRLCPAEFHAFGFADIAKLPPGFDCIYCIGNSLSYLPGDHLALFLKNVRVLLAPNGIFIAHTVNWDEYFLTGASDFSVRTLSNGARFSRNYETINKNKVLFHTFLESGEKKQNWTDSLYPKGSAELNAALLEAGFKDIRHFGNYKKDRFIPESSPVSIFIAQNKKLTQ